jgi:(p)ppGpp synthase/HD superfamily hydrolase
VADESKSEIILAYVRIDGCRSEDIKQNFGSDVARLVKGLSDSLAEDSTRKDPWCERKEAYIKHLSEESHDEVWLISAADKLYNTRAILEDYRVIGAKIWERFKRSRKDQLGYFDSLLKVHKSKGNNRIVDELGRVLAELTKISAHETA